MKPKWPPVALPLDCAPFGEHPFQPYLIKQSGLVVAGGPSALFLISVAQVPKFLITIEARVRISGFAVHEGMLYVQDGPVLSRWSIVNRRCDAAINLLEPEAWYYRTTAEPDWAALHKLKPDPEAKQNALRRARRKVEWLRMLEATEKQLATPSTRTAEQTAALRQFADDMKELVGEQRSTLRGELETAQKNAEATIISPPVVRTQQVGAKAGAVVFVLGRNGKFYSLDNQLAHKGTASFERGARPSLAIVELNDGLSDDTACRLYYVTDKGAVQCVDGDSIPARLMDGWPATGSASLEPGVRARVEGNIVWGSNAQNTGIFALPITRPGSPSLVNVPLSQEWQWLETPSDHSLAIIATDTSCRLVSYAPNTNLADRFAVKPDRAPYFSSFLRQVVKVHPLLVAEFERDADREGSGVTFRLLVANDADVSVPPPVEAYASFYPPLPTAVLEDQLEGRDAMGPPVRIRTQPSISLQDAYLMARDKTIQQQLIDLAMNSWTQHMSSIEQQYGSRANARASLGDIALPRLSGRDALYCYAIGGTVTAELGRRAFEVLEEMRGLVVVIPLRIIQTTYDVYPTRILPGKKEPVRNRTVTLIYDDGRKFNVTTDAEGRALLSREADGKFLTMQPFGSSSRFMPPHASRIFITRGGNNQIDLSVYKDI